MAKVICVVNFKGGVGKTTTATTLAHGLALHDKKVLLMDLDPQGHCAVSFGKNTTDGVYKFCVEHKNLGEVTIPVRKNLWLVPGDNTTSIITQSWENLARVTGDAFGDHMLLELLKPFLKGKTFDYVVLDTNPTIGGMQKQALWAANSVLVPATADHLGAQAISKLWQSLQGNMVKGWGGSFMGILPTMYEKSNVTKYYLDNYKQVYGKNARVFSEVHKAVLFKECTAMGKTIWEVDPKSRAALEYAQLVQHIVKVL